MSENVNRHLLNGTTDIANNLLTNAPEWLVHSFGGVSIWQIFFILVLGGIAAIIQKAAFYILVSWLKRILGKYSKHWEISILRSARPFSILVHSLVMAAGIPFLHFADSVDRIFTFAIRFMAIGSGVWLIYRQIDVVSDFLKEKAELTETRLDDQLVPLVRRVLKIFVIVTGTIFILQNLSVDVGSLVAGLGLGGLAFALAAKDTLANFFGSLVIFIDRPFQIGDWVIIGDIEGTVTDVGFRTTRIRTFYNSIITVPNSKLTGTAIDNMGARQYRRIKQTLSLTYNTTPEQMQAFVEGVRAVISAHPQTRKDYYLVHFVGFGASSLDVMLYCFLEVPSWPEELKGAQEIYHSIMKLAHKLHVSFAFPTQTLHLQSTPEKAQSLPSPLSNSDMKNIIDDFSEPPKHPNIGKGYYP